MEEFIDTLKTKELRKILSSRGLSESYKWKTELVKRLKDSITKDDTIQSLRNILVFIGEEQDDEDKFEDSLEMATNFVFKDVEDALEKFNGEATRSVNEWIKHYEDVAKTCGWNEMQMYLYARKLLQGAARKAVEADKTIGDYQLLVAKLKKEFEEELSSYEIHRKLMFKKKSSSESYLEYFYDMQKIGPKLDAVSMVRYIVDGIPEDKTEKSILYDAKTLDDLKTKLKVYESMHKSKTSSFTNRCKNCGSKSHLQDSCPDQQKGKRCFKCNNFGHVARDCTSNESDAKWIRSISLADGGPKTQRLADAKFIKLVRGEYEEK